VKPVHQQTAYAHFSRTPTGLPVSESLPERVLSLPIHPDLADEEVDQVIDAVLAAV
jgi:dTDP-4-amino-4,6-dideoxygalactose transaminase